MKRLREHPQQNGKDNIYEKAYLVHCTDQLPVMWMHKERYDIR